jgi:hypothetical protein
MNHVIHATSRWKWLSRQAGEFKRFITLKNGGVLLNLFSYGIQFRRRA